MQIEVMDLSGINRFSRVQSGWRMQDAWPIRSDGFCACGCGKRLTGRRTRWATNECGDWAYSVFAIHAGYSGNIRSALSERDGGVCVECEKDSGGRWGSWEADHIIPVCEGGGGCGLDGYQTLCGDCHKMKTAKMNKRRAEERRRDPGQIDALGFLGATR